MPSPKDKYVLRSYESTSVYILDYRDEIDNSREAMLARLLGDGESYSEHSLKCKLIRNFFKKATNWKPQNVGFSKMSEAAEFFDYWDEEISDHGAGDLFIVYFHGFGYGQNSNYSLKFRGGDNALQVNLHDFLRKFHVKGIDCLLVLDCKYVPTRGFCKWSNIEIIASGSALLESSGDINSEHDSDFTKAFAYNMLSFLKEIDGKYENYKAPRSVQEIMQMDRVMVSNKWEIVIGKRMR